MLESTSVVDHVNNQENSTVSPLTEFRVLLEGVSWETFQHLLSETGSQRHQRFAYSDGILEIMVPLAGHERPNRLFEHFLAAIVDELGLELLSLGSLTMKDPETQKGLEPDCCFYIQHEAQVREVETLDFAVHSPPDLVIEVDNSSQSLNKFPIYVALRIPEIWRLYQGQLTIYHLDLSQLEYEVKETSLSFPGVPVQRLPQFIQRARAIGQRAAVREFAEIVQQLLKNA